MTLKQYLAANGLVLDKKIESVVGTTISEKYRKLYKKAPIKRRVHGDTGKINQYPEAFLISCSDLIISILNPITEKNGEEVC